MSTRQSPADRISTYRSDDVDVTYHVGRCLHAQACIRGLPAVFNPDARPWVKPDAAPADEVAEVVQRCPSGALHVHRHDGGTAEPVPDANTVSVQPDGPLYLRGRLTLAAPDGTVLLEDTRIALCRCGASNYKPFCDGTHRKSGFQDTSAMGTTGLKPDPDADATLTIVPATDGPLLLRGRVTLQTSDGKTLSVGKAALCRCGASNNKPFCDGTHRTIGFKSAEATTTGT